jgi:hypothetical protein
MPIGTKRILAWCAERPEEEPVGVEYDDATVLRIRDVDASKRPDRDSDRKVQFAGARAMRPPTVLESPGSGELLDPVVELIDHVDEPSRIDSDSRREVELPVPAAQGPPRA